MAEPRRFLDVWILDPEKVYREVPYTVVADWVQQGRLLDDDKVRPSGKGDWVRIADSADFSPYILKPEPHRADDQAEALEPVAVDFVSTSPRPREAEDDDPDMIPLIDVSLVLLIFFMMTAAGGAGISILKPVTNRAQVAEYKDGITIAVDKLAETGAPVYYVLVGGVGPARDDSNLRTLPELMARLDHHFERAQGGVEVTIDAHEDLKASVVRDLTTELEKPARRDKVIAKYIGTRGKAS